MAFWPLLLGVSFRKRASEEAVTCLVEEVGLSPSPLALLVISVFSLRVIATLAEKAPLPARFPWSRTTRVIGAKVCTSVPS